MTVLDWRHSYMAAKESAQIGLVRKVKVVGYLRYGKCQVSILVSKSEV